MKNTILEIKKLIDDKYFQVGFSKEGTHIPTLQFKLTNYNSKTKECFVVDSLNEAEEIVISFIPTAQKGEIFTNDIYNEEKDLFLRVNVVLPTE